MERSHSRSHGFVWKVCEEFASCCEEGCYFVVDFDDSHKKFQKCYG